MRAIELFAGAGGLGLGVSRAGFNTLDIVEWDRWCCDTIRENRAQGNAGMGNWPLPREGDIRNFCFKQFEGEVDLVTGGPPCQPFSLGGKHRAYQDDRDMWSQAVRVVRETKPKAFIFENVKGLTRATFETYFSYIFLQLSYPDIAIRNEESWIDHRVRLEQHHTSRSSSSLTYQVLPPKVLNAANFGVPQKRERIFIVGFKDHRIEFDFDQLAVPEGDGPKLGSILDKTVDPKYTLTEHMWKYLQGYKEKHQKAGNGFGFSLFGPDDVARTLSARYYKDGSEILIEQKGDRPRRLTPRECARLMGFEKPGRTDWKIPVSDTQGYRQFGNAVVVPVVSAVAQLMQPRILDAMELDGREVPRTVQIQLPLPAPGIAAE